jgi:hypothetical protein
MNEVYILGGALVAAGVYIMFLHNELRANKGALKVLGYIIEQLAESMEQTESMLMEARNEETKGE